jgi:hypothetical protein
VTSLVRISRSAASGAATPATVKHDGEPFSEPQLGRRPDRLRPLAELIEPAGEDQDSYLVRRD